MVTVCARHGAQHDCINDRAGVACELGDADDLEAVVYAVESTAHFELGGDDQDQAGAYRDEGIVLCYGMDVPHAHGLAPDQCQGCRSFGDRVRRGAAAPVRFFRGPGSSDTPPCPFSLSPIPIRADGGR